MYNTGQRGLLGDRPTPLGQFSVQSQPHLTPPGGAGLLGDAPSCRGLLGDTPWHQMVVAPPPSKSYLPATAMGPSQEMLTKDLGKLRAQEGKVIIVTTKTPISEEDLINMAEPYGQLHNAIPSRQNSIDTQHKGWVEFEEHGEALNFYEAGFKRYVVHHGEPIGVGISNWKDIKRKDGKDLWRRNLKRSRKKSNAGPPAKVPKESTIISSVSNDNCETFIHQRVTSTNWVDHCMDLSQCRFNLQRMPINSPEESLTSHIRIAKDILSYLEAVEVKRILKQSKHK